MRQRDQTGTATWWPRLSESEADLAVLGRDSEKLKGYVDDHVVHRAEHPRMTEMPTFGELQGAIDDIGEMFKKYSQVLKAAHWAALEPLGQGDWRASFRQPWQEPADGSG